MSELEAAAPNIFFGEKLAKKLADQLIEEGGLPKDFYFRLLGVEDDQSTDVANVDIMAALERGDKSPQAATYLEGDLPDCVLVPGYDRTTPLQSVLLALDEDYYRYVDFAAANGAEVSQSITQQIWLLLVGQLNPSLAETIKIIKAPHYVRSGISRAENLEWVRNRTIIRDQTVLDIYQGRRQVAGMGIVRMGLIYNMLLDNHPELEWPELEAVDTIEE